MAFPFQFIFTTFYQCCWLFCDGSNVTRFMGKLWIRLLQLCTVLTHGRFAMGKCSADETFLFFTVSMIMWPILIYNLHAFAISLYVLLLHQVLRVRLSCADQI